MFSVQMMTDVVKPYILSRQFLNDLYSRRALVFCILFKNYHYCRNVL